MYYFHIYLANADEQLVQMLLWGHQAEKNCLQRALVKFC